MNLHLPTLPANVVLQPASRCLKRITDRNIDVFVLRMRLHVLHPFLFGAALDGTVQTRFVPALRFRPGARLAQYEHETALPTCDGGVGPR